MRTEEGDGRKQQHRRKRMRKWMKDIRKDEEREQGYERTM